MWKYDNDSELVRLMFMAKHFKEKGYKICLTMPYIPNARYDRVKKENEVFTLKYFSEVINSLGFEFVEVLDPHSYVSEALIDRIIVKHPEEFIYQTLNKILMLEMNSCSYHDRLELYNNMVFFYPDEGAMKRYSSVLDYPMPIAFGMKKRDWATGNILGLDVMNAEAVKDKTILIIDDICSKGGTFYHSAKALKDLGARNIYLYVTHCENTIREGDLIDSNLIERIFTTDTIYRENLDKIEVLSDL
jgi:ribose-phosphate pyrophosphokinase